MSKATVKCSGTVYEGWKSVSISRSIDTISSSFKLNFKDSWTAEKKLFGINPQDEISIEINGIPMITGYIDVFDGALANSSTYNVVGRDRSSDVVDCSVPLTPTQYKNMSLLTLCNTLAKETGVTFLLSPTAPAAATTPFTLWTVQPDEKIFESIDRACRMRGVLMVADGSGRVLLSGTGIVRNLTPLIEGDNVKAVSYKIDYSNRYSDYTVRGQHNNATLGFGDAGAGGAKIQVKGTAADAGVRRKRRLTIHAESMMTPALAQARAEWEATVRAARSLTVTVTVYEWTDSQNIPWQLNTLVTLKAPKTGIEGTFLISGTEFGLNESGGSETVLTLLRPDAFTSEPVVPKKKSDQVAKGFQIK